MTPDELADLNAWDVARMTDPEPLLDWVPRLRCIPNWADVKILLVRYEKMYDAETALLRANQSTPLGDDT